MNRNVTHNHIAKTIYIIEAKNISNINNGHVQPDVRASSSPQRLVGHLVRGLGREVLWVLLLGHVR